MDDVPCLGVPNSDQAVLPGGSQPGSVGGGRPRLDLAITCVKFPVAVSRIWRVVSHAAANHSPAGSLTTIATLVSADGTASVSHRQTRTVPSLAVVAVHRPCLGATIPLTPWA